MEMRKYIELGEKKAGSQIKLAEFLGQYDSGLRAVKAGKKGLPDVVCIKLADYIEADRLEVIAASNLVTEKDEEKRRIFESCFKNRDIEILHKENYLQKESPNTNYWQLNDICLYHYQCF